MLNCFNSLNHIHMYSHCQSYLEFGLTRVLVDEINSGTTICVLSSTANTMHADALATLGANASEGLVLTPQSRNILSSASEELKKEPLAVTAGRLSVCPILKSNRCKSFEDLPPIDFIYDYHNFVHVTTTQLLLHAWKLSTDGIIKIRTKTTIFFTRFHLSCLWALYP